jgi:hypothetical protein
MASGGDCFYPGRNDIDDGGGEQDGDDNYGECLAHCSLLPVVCKTKDDCANAV